MKRNTTIKILGVVCFLLALLSSAYASDTIKADPNIVEAMRQSREYQAKLIEEKQAFAALHGGPVSIQTLEVSAGLTSLRAKLKLLMVMSQELNNPRYKGPDNFKSVVNYFYEIYMGLSRNSEMFLISRHKDHVDEHAMVALHYLHNGFCNPASLFWNNTEKDLWTVAGKNARNYVRQMYANLREIHDNLPKPEHKVAPEDYKYTVGRLLEIVELFLYRQEITHMMTPVKKGETADYTEETGRLAVIHVQQMNTAASMFKYVLGQTKKAQIDSSLIEKLDSIRGALISSHDAFFRVLEKSKGDMDFDNAIKVAHEKMETARHDCFFRVTAKILYN